MSKETNYLQQIENLAHLPTLAVLRAAENYTNGQWFEVQKNCWNVGRSEVNAALGKEDVGFSINGMYLDFLPEQDFKGLLKATEKYIRHLQAEKAGYRPMLRNMPNGLFNLDNWTRFLLARKAAWICSAAIGEVQLKGRIEDQDLQLLGVFVDNENKPLTRHTLTNLIHSFPQKLS